MGLYACAPGDLWRDFQDLHECLDLGHANQARGGLRFRVEG